MKTTALLLCSLGLSLAFLIGCGGGESAPVGTAAEIADKVFEESGVSFRAPENHSLAENDKREFYLGSTDYPAFADSVAVVPLMRLDTRVLYVIKAADKDDVEDIMATLEVNIDPNRLICVTFTLDDVVLDSRGDVIFMTINSEPEQRTALAEAFQTIE